MRPYIDKSKAQPLIWTATETHCDVCGHPLAIAQHRRRYVIRLDGVYRNVRRDKHCTREGCPMGAKLYRPLEDIRLALPYMSYGLDVVLLVGEQHVHQKQSLRQIGRDLWEREVKVDQSHVGELLRAYLALCEVSRSQEALVARLVAQGGIVLMVDGVQFDNRSPVVYVGWDALSGTVLCSERQPFRGQRDLEPLLMRIKEMGIKVLGVVSDKDTGLVPAVEKVFKEVPHQLCQTHFLKNCAKGMEPDLKALGESVEQRAEKVREVEARMHKARQKKQAAGAAVNLAVCLTEASPSKGSPPPLDSRSAEPAAARPKPPGADVGEVPPEVAPQAVEAAQPAAERPEPPVAPDSAEPAAARPKPPGADVGEVPPEVAPKAKETASEEELATQFCALVRANARVSGRALLAPAQMERHQRLEQIRQSLDEVRKKKAHPTPLLDALSHALKPNWHAARTAGRVERHVELLREVTRRIVPDPKVSERPSASQAEAEFTAWLADLQAKTPRRGLNAPTAHFIDHLVATAGRWCPRLFTCYTDPRIPATTNSLEGFFGCTKSQLRQALGRGSTVGSPMHNLDFALLPLMPAAKQKPAAAGRPSLQMTVDTEAYRKARKSLDQREQPAKQRRSWVRSLVNHLARLVGAAD